LEREPKLAALALEISFDRDPENDNISNDDLQAISLPLQSIYPRICRDIESDAVGGVYFSTGRDDDEERFYVDKETSKVTLIPRPQIESSQSDFSDEWNRSSDSEDEEEDHSDIPGPPWSSRFDELRRRRHSSEEEWSEEEE
jgi:hypothetical protein